MRGGADAGRDKSPGCFYPVYINPATKEIVEIGESLPPDMHPSDIPEKEGLVTVWPIGKSDGLEKRWRTTPENFRELRDRGYAKVGAYDSKSDRWSLLYLGRLQRERIDKGELKIIGRDANGVVSLEEAQGSNVLKAPKTIWNRQAHNAGEYGSRLIKSLVPGRVFSYPKSLYAVEDTLRSILKDKPNSLVVDFFAGSGTTAHAVLRLNKQDGGCRKSIIITNNEVSLNESNILTKEGIRQGDKEWERLGICEYITKPRITAAITGVTPDGEPIQGKYGTEREVYVQDKTLSLIDTESGKQVNKSFYVKKKVNDPAVRDPFPMSEGFEENAIFFNLTYLEPAAIELGAAYEEIAPLLWLRAGAKGEIVAKEQRSFAITETYAILFDYAYAKDFIKALEEGNAPDTIYVVTDDSSRYANISKQFPDKDVVQLYESYLRSFKIAAEDAVR